MQRQSYFFYFHFAARFGYFPMQQQTVQKSIIRDFYRRAIGQGDIDFADQIIADDYIQHSLNPSLKPGKEGVLAAIAYMKEIPKPTTTSPPFMRLIAEGDFVVTNLRFNWGGSTKVVVDLFRFQDGKLAEHWDVIQDQPETSLNDNAFMDGPQPNDNSSLTADNKHLVSVFFQDVFVERQLHALLDFVVPDMKQHNPEIADGPEGLVAYIQQQAATGYAPTMLRVIAESDFVVIQSEGLIDQKPVLSFDIFRLCQQKIVEHWSVKGRAN